MKERPILFSTRMVQAILEGRKTMTRRVVKGEALNWLSEFTPEFVALSDNNICPYGKPGDILWVRETWAHKVNEYGENDGYYYKASYTKEYDGSRWNPSIHMPKAACRLRLKIISIRVERLHDITQQDGKAEGAEAVECGPVGCYTCGFHQLWESINGLESWDENPWVWVIEFEKI